MFPDLTLDPKVILIDAINAANFPGTLPRALTVDDVVFADPQPLGADAANTTIPMGVVAGSRAELGAGTVNVVYNRIDVGHYLTTDTAPLDGSAATHVSDVLGQINTQYDLNLQTTDIIDQPLDKSDPANVTGVLVIKQGNLIYTGNAVLVFASEEVIVPSLQTAVAVRKMNGLTPPVAPG